MKINFSDLKNYYIIGNLHTCALVTKGGSIDWMCLPNFDSPSIFGRILDKKAGSFSVKDKSYTLKTNYFEDTAILEHHFKKSQNEFLLRDFMPPNLDVKGTNHFLVRKFQCLKGKNNIHLLFDPKGNYGEVEPEIKKIENTLTLELHDHIIIIYLPIDTTVKIKKGKAELIFNLKSNEEKTFVMEYFNRLKSPKYESENFEEPTKKFWHQWVESGNYFNYSHDVLVRAMITLRLLQYYPSGVLVAAPSCSLPAEIGGVRNWDYRYVWIRDVTFTLFAFNILDCEEEVISFFNFMYKIIEKHSDKNFDINTVYTIKGDKAPKENFLRNLSGYKNSKPVRVGNNATMQFQMDKYGDLINAHYFLLKQEKDFKYNKQFIIDLADKICEIWKEKDSGIWEMRGEQQHYTYSKVMCWVGLDRVIKMERYIRLNKSKVENYKKVRTEIKEWIWENCYNKKKKSFEQYPGADYQDATNYLFVILQFLDKNDKLTKTIVKNTSKELCEDEIFVYRYKVDDGLEGSDNSFLLCSFWMISAWAILEEVDKAEDLYKKLLEKFDGHYLISEQMKKDKGELTGNFPQAYSHLGITMAAYYINKYKQRKKNKSELII